MKKLYSLFVLICLSNSLLGQTYKSSKTFYVEDKITEKIERTIQVGADTITIISKGKQAVDIQRLVIQYASEGKMKKIGKAMIYQCSAIGQPFYYDIGIQIGKVEKIGITEANILEKSWKNMVFYID